MFSLRDLPSVTSILSTHAAITGYIVIFKPYLEKIIPPHLQDYITTYLKSYFDSSPTNLTLIIEDMTTNGVCNELYAAAQVYASTKINRDAAKLRISRQRGEKNVKFYLSNGDVVYDVYEGIDELKWKYTCNSEKSTKVNQFFELSFEKKHRDLVLSSYIPYVERKAKMINNERRILKMHSYNVRSGWNSVNLEHPSTFDTMAMNKELKRSVVEDLDRFIRRKDYYKRVGKAWKRGYLMYGPPGTGKTSLVAAMANYLKFDIYDLQLASIKGDDDLRRSLLGTKNSSILVIEDIDCSVDLPTRLQPKSHDDSKESETLTLSGLLNCIDGLWSTCGDERIVIFTTNHKERLDPALLRPGRMDMHIYMGHCCFDGFKTLASNYLSFLSEDDHQHHLYPEIKRLISGEVLTPAQVAEELMKYEDADEALEGLVRVLKKERSGLEKDDDGEFKKDGEA